MAEGSNENQDPGSAMDIALRCTFKEVLENCNDYRLFRLTQFYRDRLELAIKKEVKSISLLLKERQHFSEKEHTLLVENKNQANSSKLLLTLVMEKGSAARRVMWEAFLKTTIRLPKLEKILKEIQEFGTNPDDYLKNIRDFAEVPSELKDVQKQHMEELRKQTEQLRMNTIHDKEVPKVCQLVDRYAELTIIPCIRDWKLVEHELLAKGQEHEEWRERQLHDNLDIIGMDKLFCSSYSRSKYNTGNSSAVSGIPGIGKTTMVQKIIYDWSTEKIYPKFKFVFSFKFRELNDTNCRITLRELILIQYPYLKNVLSEIWKIPEQILFLFDGLDEYKFRIDFADTQKYTDCKHVCKDPDWWCEVADIVYALIQRTLLPGCSVLLTSRPTALQSLQSAKIDIWAEILGFSHEERKEYFNKYFEDQAVAAAIFKHVHENQILYTMSFNPSYCWILGQTLGPIFIKRGNDLQRIPKTITELYSYHIYNILKNHSRLEQPRDVLLKIGKMAFAGVSEKNIMFRNGDLVKYDLQPSQCLSGFVIELLERDNSVQNVVYAFTHLTVQEFVAALAQFLTADRGDIKKLFKKADQEEDGRYELFLRFIVGLSSKSHQPLQEFLGQFPHETTCEVIDWIRMEIKKRFETTRSRADKRKLLNMFHYLFESQNVPLAETTVGAVKALKFSGLQMNPIDCAVLSNVIGLCDAINDLDLQNCTIQCDGLRWLKPGLHKCVVLRLWNNKLGDSGVKLLSVVLKDRQCKINELQLGANNLTDSCIEDLASALSENRSLLVLELSNNKLGNSGMKYLSVALKNPHCKIQKLGLQANGLTDACVEDLSSALSINQSLTALCLGSNKLGDTGVQQLPKCLRNVENLELDDNNLSVCCTEDLASTLSTYWSLRALNLSNNNLGDSGMKNLSAALTEVDQNLEELRLSALELTVSCAPNIASMIRKSCSLTVLDLSGNKLGDKGMELLCEGLRNWDSKILMLKFGKNNLTDLCTKHLVFALCAVKLLQTLSLKSNSFTDESVEPFRKLIKNCKNLKMIDLDENNFSSQGQEQLLSMRGQRCRMRVIV